MQVDYLIIGQGISGTWLSYFLKKEGKSFIVIDDNAQNAPSKIAAGIINPVTGRRHASVWLAEELMPFVLDAYSLLAEDLSIDTLSVSSIIDFFPSAQMRLSFSERVSDQIHYVSLPPDEKKFLNDFKYELGYGQIDPVYIVHLEKILPVWRHELVSSNSLIETSFDPKEIEIGKEDIRYHDIIAQKIIFCDGTSSTVNPWFSLLPFAPNKGEALTLQIKDLDRSFIYKRGLTLAPFADADQWWIGSSYEWDFDNVSPTKEFLQRSESLLKEWLRRPFEITGHYASLRPATLERRPFVGFHPQNDRIGILNGMGTKGCSLAPFFAKQLVANLINNTPIYPDADVQRFRSILSRKVD
jgi:glycine/D-amino acid oxidase-like deaminating enzyme